MLAGMVTVAFVIAPALIAPHDPALHPHGPTLHETPPLLSLIDVVLVVGLGLGVFWRSRVAATTLAVYFIAAKLIAWSPLDTVRGWPVAFMLTILYIRVLYATIRWHRHLKAVQRHAQEPDP
jgi:hypothetical protein